MISNNPENTIATENKSEFEPQANVPVSVHSSGSVTVTNRETVWDYGIQPSSSTSIPLSSSGSALNLCGNYS